MIFLKYSVSLFIMEMHIKVTLGFHLTPGIITVINKVTEEEAGEDVGKKEHLFLLCMKAD